MPRLLAGAVLSLGLAAVAGADTIVLVDGRVLEADHAWYEGSEVRCRRDGTLYTLPRDAVERLEPSPERGEIVLPEVERSREALAAGDRREALRYARLALFKEPESPAGLEALAAAQLALDEAGSARQTAESAVRLAPGRASSHELLADVLVNLGEIDAARTRYLRALDLGDEARIRRKLRSLEPASALVSSARFRVKYRGDADEALGFAVLNVMDRTWDEYEGYLGFSPDLPVTVVLQTDAAFRDTTRAPGWAAAWNDGTIRLPVRGLVHPTPGVVRVLRHELAHSFLTSRVGPACPTWLQEGVAQWLEGGDPAREDAELRAAAQHGRLTALRDLERPFSALATAEASSAYAQSLSAVAHLLRIGGRAGLRRFIDALAAGRDTAEALAVAYGLDYDRLQSQWMTHLREPESPSGRTAATGR